MIVRSLHIRAAKLASAASGAEPVNSSMPVVQYPRQPISKSVVAHATRILFALVSSALCTLPARAAELDAAEAAHHVGETATVCGIVASGKFDADLKSQPTFLDFEKPYPDQVFTAVIFGSDRSKFGTPETSLRGAHVCVTGRIQDRSGLPEIILYDPKQLSQ